MRSEEELGSAYGPIRLRNSIGWIYAHRLAREGRITADGRIANNLYQSLHDELFVPAMQLISASVRSGDLEEEFVGPALAKLFALENWIPMYGQYELAGRQIFDLHDRLTEMLLVTDLGDATLEKLHLPYDALYVRFGAQDSIKLPFDEERFEFFDGAFVAKAPWDESGSRIKIGFTTVHEDGTGVGYPGYFFDILPDELTLPVAVAIDMAMTRRLATYRDNTDDSSDMRALNAYRREYVEESATMLRAASTLLVNALFYLESIGNTLPPAEPGRDTPPERIAKWLQAPISTRHKQRSGLTADGYAVVRLVGAELCADVSTVGTDGRATVRIHWRRGHWRQQRHGKGLSLVKRVWIKPVLVGKDARVDDASLPGHVYVAGSTNRMQ